MLNIRSRNAHLLGWLLGHLVSLRFRLTPSPCRGPQGRPDALELFTRAIYSSYLLEIFTGANYSGYLLEISARPIYWNYLLELFIGVVGAERMDPPRLLSRAPLCIHDDAVHWADWWQAFATSAAELRDDDDIHTVVKDRPKLRRAGTQTGVAVDAGLHIDAQRSRLPLRVTSPRLNPLFATLRCHAPDRRTARAHLRNPNGVGAHPLSRWLGGARHSQAPSSHSMAFTRRYPSCVF